MLSCEHKNFASKIGNGFFHVHVQSSTSVYTCMSHGKWTEECQKQTWPLL